MADGDAEMEADADGAAVAEGLGVGDGSGATGTRQYERFVTSIFNASFASSAFALLLKHPIWSPVGAVKQYALAAGEGPADGEAEELGDAEGLVEALGEPSPLGPTWTPVR